MRDNEDWVDMDLETEVHRYIEARSQLNLDARKALVRFAAILCRCEPWYDYRDPAPAQSGCTIHTTIMFDRDGEWF